MNDYLLDHDDPGDFLGKENDYYKKGKTATTKWESWRNGWKML